jgi:hypothetical protein
MKTEYIVILAGIGLVALLWLLLRFGKAIARAALVGGLLLAGGALTFAALSQAEAHRRTAQAALVAVEGQTAATFTSGLLVGVLAVVVVGALAGGGYLAVRWQLAERRLRALPQQRRRPLPAGDPPEIVYIDDGVDLTGLDLSQWGW